MAVIMLRVGGAENLSVSVGTTRPSSLLTATKLPPNQLLDHTDGTITILRREARSKSNDDDDDDDDDAKVSLSFGSRPTDRMNTAASSTFQTARIVGPLVYVHFWPVANLSDAVFDVDLLFQHPSYAEASLQHAAFYGVIMTITIIITIIIEYARFVFLL